MPPPKLTLVLPAHNEAGVIGASVRRVDAYLSTLDIDYRIVVGDSASTDGTREAVLAVGLSSVHVIHNAVPGKGAMIDRCFQESDGEVLGFIDADLEIDVSYVGPMLAAIEDGADAVIASKTLDPGLNRDRPLSRRLNTWLYNGIVRFLFNTPFRDHQAGLKLFRTGPLRAALPHVSATAWLWDTELLVTLLRDGRRIDEFPIQVTPRDDSRFVATGNPAGLLKELVALYRRKRRT